jgi:molybdate transport system regulatory protein
MRGAKSVTKKASTKGGFNVRGHIWVEGAEGTFLGMGRVALLEGIRDTGSITGAAKRLKMSYRRAWELVESMNRQSAEPLIKASTGGKGGGGASLTEAGEKAIAAFKRMDEAFATFREKESKRFP